MVIFPEHGKQQVLRLDDGAVELFGEQVGQIQQTFGLLVHRQASGRFRFAAPIAFAPDIHVHFNPCFQMLRINVHCGEKTVEGGWLLIDHTEKNMLHPDAAVAVPLRLIGTITYNGIGLFRKIPFLHTLTSNDLLKNIQKYNKPAC